jgi:hypothetical protein
VLFGFQLLGAPVLGLVFAFALNLNRVAVLLGIYSNRRGSCRPTTPSRRWSARNPAREDPARADAGPVVRVCRCVLGGFRLARSLTPLLWSFALGATLGSVILALIAYRVALAMIVAHRRHLEHSQQAK